MSNDGGETLNGLTDLLRRYQRYSPERGEFDAPRSLSEYARLSGIDKGTLSVLYNNPDTQPSTLTILRLVALFPAAADELPLALREEVARLQLPQPDPVTA